MVLILSQSVFATIEVTTVEGLNRSIGEIESYQFTAQQDKFSSQTLSQHFRREYDAKGVAVYFDQQQLRLELNSIQRADYSISTSSGMLHQDGQRLIRTVSTGIKEWYENTSAGLEHGIDLKHKPEGTGKLTVLFDVQGAVPSQHGSSIRLQANNRLFDYSKLVVIDS